MHIIPDLIDIARPKGRDLLNALHRELKRASDRTPRELGLAMHVNSAALRTLTYLHARARAPIETCIILVTEWTLTNQFELDARVAEEALTPALRARLRELLAGLDIASYAAVFKDFKPGHSMSHIKVPS